MLVCTSIKTALFIYGFDLFVLLLLMTVFEKERRKELWSFATYIVKHQMVNALQTGLYNNYPDKGIVESINLIISDKDLPVSDWEILTPVYDLIGGGYPEKLRFANDCLNTDRKSFLLFQLRIIMDTYRVQFNSYTPTDGVLYYIYMIYSYSTYIGYTYIVAIISLIILIINWIREKKCPYVLLGIFGGMTSIYVSVFWGSYGSWGRLLFSDY